MKARDIINEADAVTVKNIKRLLTDHPEAIFHLHNPTDDMLIYAMHELGDMEYFLEKIRNPSEKVLMAAVDIDPDVIQYIRKPTDKMWMAAIKSDPSVIQSAKKQTPAMQMLAYRVDPESLRFMEKPAPELMKLAVEQGHSKYLAHVMEITDAKTQLDAIKANPRTAYQIKNMKPMALKWLLNKNESTYIVGVISDIPVETIEACKTEMIRFILRCIKNREDMHCPYEYPNMRSFLYANKHSLIKWLEARKINWPELEMIKKSLKVMKPSQLGEADV